MMFLDNIPMKRKLIGGFIFIIALALIIALVGFFSMGGMADKAEAMYDDNLVALDQLLTADNSFLNIRINAYKTVFAKDERKDKFEEIDNEIVNIKEKLDLYRQKAYSEQEIALLKEFDTNWLVFEKTLQEIISDMEAEREDEALVGIYSDDFAVYRDKAQDALDSLEAYNQERARILKDEITATYQSSSYLFLIIGIITLIFGIGLALLLNQSITGPLRRTANMIQEMGMGHLGMRLNMARADEIGQMSEVMDAFAENLQNQVIRTMQKIAGGEIVTEVPIMDEKDEIGPAILETADTIRNLIEETDALVKAAKEGRLSVRGNENSFKGGYRDIVNGFNSTLDNLLVPLNEAMSLSEYYAKGDFSARFSEDIVVKGDFIPFKQALNTIGIESGKAIGLVQSEIISVLTSMQETSARADEISKGAKLVASNASEVSNFSEKSSQGIAQILHAMNELAITVSSVANETTGVASLTQQTNDLSIEGTKLVELTDEGMKSIKTSFEETNTVVQEIDAQMGEIGSIVEVIGGIADQTNLLALNAAIEAARAGDAGLGFAVVADEVKTLAEESRLSTEKIAELITVLQKKSKNVTISMEQSLVDVNQGDTAVKEMMKIFEQIAESIDTASKQISDVAAHTEEQAAAVEEISASVHELETISVKTAQESISASSATEEVSSSIDQVSEAITYASDSIEKISNAMDKFHVS